MERMGAATVSAVVLALDQRLRDHYVFPEVAAAMGEDILQRSERGEYEGIATLQELAERLTIDLRAISKDTHVVVRWNKNTPAATDDGESNSAHSQGWEAHGRLANYGFHRVERLPGNIGYLDLRGFFPAASAGPTAVAAMAFVAETDALIVDLRKNGGGDPSGIALLCSYLFPPEPVHLNDLYWRPDGSTQQWWTLPWVPGKRYVDKPVYVLTSSYTFSGAEEFSYNLQQLKRAMIVGENTGGGANPGGMYRIWERLEAFIPSGRAINPYTKTNWEGTGVVPDKQVPANDALHVAQKEALEHVLASKGDSPSWPYSQIADEARTALAAMRTAGDPDDVAGKSQP